MMRVSILWWALALAGVGVAGSCALGEPYELVTVPSESTTTVATAGNGGSTTTNHGAGGVGAGGPGGAGGGGFGGASGGCPSDTTWFVTLPGETSTIAMAPGNVDVLVGHSSAAPGQAFLSRLDGCTGALLATASSLEEDASAFFPKIAIVIEGELVSVGNGRAGVGGGAAEAPQAYRLDPTTLQPIAPPYLFPPFDGSYDEDDEVFAATVEPSGAIWLSGARHGGLWRYQRGPEDSIHCDVAVGNGQYGRGIAATDTGLVLSRIDGARELLFIDLSSTTPGTCPAAENVQVVDLPSYVGDSRALAATASVTIAASLVDEGDGNWQAGLTRFDGIALQASFNYPEPANAHPGIDAFFSVAIDPPSVTPRRIFFGGVESGTVEPMTGAGFVAAISMNFNNAPTFEPTAIGSAKWVSVIALAEDAVYIGGQGAAADTGFVARCTRELQCPDGF